MKSLIKTILKFTTVVILLFIAIVAIINTSPFDEGLNPEVKKIMHDIPMPVVEGNAYYALYGLNAIADKDMITAGHELILRYLENRNNSNDELTTNDYEELLGLNSQESTSWKIEGLSCDSRTDYRCLNTSSKMIANEDLNNPRLQVMLERYRNIIEMKVYDNFQDMTMATPLAAYGDMLKLSHINLASTYQPINRSEFILQLHKDMMFWKMILNKGQFVIDKMIAVAAIGKDVNFLSEYFRNNSILKSDEILIKNILAPLTADELDISDSFITESMGFFNSIDTAETNFTWFKNLVFQPNATKNYYFESYLQNQIHFSQLPLNEMILEYPSKSNDNKNTQYKLHYLYNFSGKSLIDIGMPSYSDYIIRGYDLNNIIKMANIQLQAKLSDQQTIQQLLSQPKNANLFNNKPFEYDEKTQLLQFKCLAKHSQCKIKL